MDSIERYLDIFEGLRRRKRWSTDSTVLRFAALTLASTDVADPGARLEETAAALTKAAATFSPIKSAVRHAVAAILIRRGLDPISVVRRHARESLRAIQETQRTSGKPVPEVRLGDPLAFESHYPPRGLSWPPPVEVPRPHGESSGSQALADLQRAVSDGLAPENYRDLNNSNNQAPGAKRMMVRGMAPLDRAVGRLSAEHPQAAATAFRQLIESPYPFAHYLAMRELLQRHKAQAITINCLGGFYGGHIKAYPCLGFTQLNDDGLVGACEADLFSTVTMRFGVL